MRLNLEWCTTMKNPNCGSHLTDTVGRTRWNRVSNMDADWNFGGSQKTESANCALHEKKYIKMIYSDYFFFFFNLNTGNQPAHEHKTFFFFFNVRKSEIVKKCTNVPGIQPWYQIETSMWLHFVCCVYIMSVTCIITFLDKWPTFCPPEVRKKKKNFTVNM